MKALWPNNRLPDFIKVKVLRELTSAELRDWTPPGKRFFEKDRVETLRAVASDTLNFGDEHGGAFGFGGNAGRKASPTKLKVGHFDAGYRLISIIDKRNGRDGNLAAAVGALVTARKPLGFLLKDAGFSRP